ncbi:hypothetical protein [Flavobacterium hydatis]|uniref:Uncharacterized protein n=1 Tax=Flavobacterium hydatis TaxID=991 RepID=A0A086AUI3_FLAHY|nr:hypothetical protein [Flavobacterium hydatis]KFF20347.1 hypothetical protein IW20_00890 [Flavobacterium hydatis]OXA98363.1 hypothetical protein B0A62_00765 [Flavobacterium hydatis]
MEIIKNINEIFSNRELATIVWLAIILILINLNKEIRNSAFQVIKAFFVKQILLVFFLLAVYAFFIVLFLKYYRFWDFTLLKETLFWFFGFALMTLFKLEKANEASFFFKILIESFKLTIFLEFFLNFYTFSFVTEMIVIPIFTFVFLMNLISENKDEYKPVFKLTKIVIGFVGAFYIVFAIYKFIFHNENILSVHNLNSLILPVQLTILSIPFFYFLSLYSNYERLFLRVEFMNKDSAVQRNLKLQILKKANINLSKLKKIDEKLTGFNLFELTDINRKDENSNNADL